MAEAYIEECLDSPDPESSENPAKEVQNAPKPPPSSSIPLQKLPNELLLHIIMALSPCSATCFGLTCHRLYKLYKVKYPRPVSLDENQFLGWSDWYNRIPLYTCLGLLLSSWRGIGPRFRIWQPEITPSALRRAIPLPVWHFIPIATYGEQSKRRNSTDSDKFRLESELYLRYQDYHLMHIDGKLYLLYPRNKSKEEWMREAMDVIILDRQRHSDKWAWIKFWQDTVLWSRGAKSIMIEEQDIRTDALIKEIKRGFVLDDGARGRVESLFREQSP
ncbi:hypothetical protein N431DRAFT_458578 [Stipitochalara longipes BDJ]|nr:hypothetical protein N431DRAFT_458578 [Stipitochalara longipes BDJ]